VLDHVPGNKSDPFIEKDRPQVHSQKHIIAHDRLLNTPYLTYGHIGLAFLVKKIANPLLQNQSDNHLSIQGKET
jgi:hypothetical protein